MVEQKKAVDLLEMEGASRERYWSELNDSEKLERMRGILKSAEYAIQQLTSDIEYLRDKFIAHSHSDAGNVIENIQKTPKIYDRPSPRRLGDKPNDVYF